MKKSLLNLHLSLMLFSISSMSYSITWYTADVPYNGGARGWYPSVSAVCQAHAATSNSRLSGSYQVCGETRGRSSYVIRQYRERDDKWQATLQYAADLRNEPACPTNYSANNSGSCSAYCLVGQTWDPNTNSCVSPNTQNNCSTTTPNPIDLIEGEKYRNEHLFTVGNVFPIVLNYHYNSQKGTERNENGVVASKSLVNSAFSAHYFEADVKPFLTQEQVAARHYVDYYRHGPEYDERQHAHGYWKHNYQHWIKEFSNSTLWYRPTGKPIRFSLTGNSSAYPDYRMTREADGSKTIYAKSENKVYRFNEAKDLVSITDEITQQTHSITYIENTHRIASINHSLGGSLSFTYENKIINPKAVAPSFGDFSSSYPILVEDNTGRKIDIAWNESYEGNLQTYHLITTISHTYLTERNGHREYEYNHSTFATALTNIYDQFTADATTKQLYASFEYDSAGRATYSALADGYDAISVSYDSETQRTTTSALNKKATYTFGMSDGAIRLLSVTGEPTQNCLQSETSFTYYSDGSTQTKTINGVTTAYQYNDRGLETQRIEAQGTPEQKTITTEWHPTFTLPTKITQGNRVTIMTYDDNGRLENETVYELN